MKVVTGPVCQITDMFLYYRFSSKVLERIVYCRLDQYLSKSHILVTEQYGFRKDRSKEHAA